MRKSPVLLSGRENRLACYNELTYRLDGEEGAERGEEKQYQEHPVFGRAGGADRPSGGKDLHREI